ncbi:uncharacterized protein LOC116632639 [Phoca vitulina]|uniref:uncharacterized protein LOC116632639 n=1 Tax=Phoca vitulina TaxID=9720 RepID=UPI00139645D0|nr:uncharacterized protein LOC116632639 [Phoca vitulina]
MEITNIRVEIYETETDNMIEKITKSESWGRAWWAKWCFCREGGQRPGSRQHGLRISWVAWGERVPFLGVHLGVVARPLRGQKTWQRQHAAHSLPQEQRHQLRAASLGASLLLCFAIDSEPLLGCVTAFLGQTGKWQKCSKTLPQRISAGGKEADSSVPVRRRKVLIRELARVREQLWDSWNLIWLSFSETSVNVQVGGTLLSHCLLTDNVDLYLLTPIILNFEVMNLQPGFPGGSVEFALPIAVVSSLRPGSGRGRQAIRACHQAS